MIGLAAKMVLIFLFGGQAQILGVREASCTQSPHGNVPEQKTDTIWGEGIRGG